MNSRSLLVVAAAISATYAKHIQIQIRENITHSCPNVKTDIIDQDSIKFKFEMIEGGEGQDQVSVTDQSGETRVVSFPGCYRVHLSFKLARPIKNPYIEAFMQLGTNIPCQPAGRNLVSNICTNITQTNWCPQSGNEKVRTMLKNKNTCRFCHLCETVKAEEQSHHASLQKFITNEGSEQCSTEEQKQTLTFKMCTPTRRELQKQNVENEGKLEEYWNYLKQGVLTAVVHVIDRQEMPARKMAQCQKLCSTYETKRGVSSSYKKTLLKSIESLCVPQDNYAACIYHTLKFDLNGDFA